MPIAAHFRELRARAIASLCALAAASCAAYAFFPEIARFMLRPFEALGGAGLYATSLFEGFVTRVELSILAGFAASLPLHLANACAFVVPGLTRRESRVLIASLCVGGALAAGGFLYAYEWLVPAAIAFLASPEFYPEGVGMLLGYQRSVLLVIQLLAGAMLLSLVPVLVLTLVKLGAASVKDMLKAGRYVTVGAFVVAAILTPPDAVSQICLALPLVALYYLSLLAAKLLRFDVRKGGAE
jgi:sec-independent protein translocase protein TatC